MFGGESVAVLEDFRELELTREGRKQVYRSHFRRDKGHRGEWQAFSDAIRSGGESPIPFEQIIFSTLATFAARDSLLHAKPVDVNARPFLDVIRQLDGPAA